MLKDKGCSEIYIVDISPGIIRKIGKSVENTKFNSNTKITIISIPYKASILDFSEEQAIKNYESGYETTMKLLERKSGNWDGSDFPLLTK